MAFPASACSTAYTPVRSVLTASTPARTSDDLLMMRLASGQAQGHELGRLFATPDRHDNVLFAVIAIGHGAASRAGGQLGGPEHLAAPLVVGAELLAPVIRR